MPIHTQNYRHWEGTLNPSHYTRWWIIAKAELKLLAQRKIVRLIVAIPPVIYILAHAVIIYIVNQFPGSVLPIDIDSVFFRNFLFNASLFIALIAVFGGGRINRHGSEEQHAFPLSI